MYVLAAGAKSFLLLEEFALYVKVIEKIPSDYYLKRDWYCCILLGMASFIDWL
jgi:hypothetical protein